MAPNQRAAKKPVRLPGRVCTAGGSVVITQPVAVISRPCRTGRPNNVLRKDRRALRVLSVEDYCSPTGLRLEARGLKLSAGFKSWTVPLAVGAAYYIAAEVGHALAFPSAPVSVFW